MRASGLTEGQWPAFTGADFTVKFLPWVTVNKTAWPSLNNDFDFISCLFLFLATYFPCTGGDVSSSEDPCNPFWLIDRLREFTLQWPHMKVDPGGQEAAGGECLQCQVDQVPAG